MFSFHGQPFITQRLDLRKIYTHLGLCFQCNIISRRFFVGEQNFFFLKRDPDILLFRLLWADSPK